MTESQIYWWLMLDGIKGIIQFLAFLLSVGLFISTVIGIVSGNGDDNDIKFGKTMLKISVWITIPTVLLIMAAVLTPSTKQYAMIKIFPAVINSDLSKEIQTDVPEMYKMARDYLKETLEKK